MHGKRRSSPGWQSSRAQRKAGSKWADGRSRTRSSSGGPSGAGRDGRCLQHRRDSSASSFPPRRRSLPSKRPRADSISPLHPSCSPSDHWRSPDFHCRRASPRPSARGHSHASTSPSRWHCSRDRSSLVGAPRPAWLRDLLGTTLCHQEAVLLTLIGDYPGAALRHLGPTDRPSVASTATPPPGHHHLELTGAYFHILRVHALRPRTANAGDVIMKRTNVFFVFLTSLLSLMPEMRTRTPHRIPLRRILASLPRLSGSGGGGGVARYSMDRTLSSVSGNYPESLPRHTDSLQRRHSGASSSPSSRVTQQQQGFRPSSSSEETLRLEGQWRGDGHLIRWRTPHHWVITVVCSWSPNPSDPSDQSSISRNWTSF